MYFIQVSIEQQLLKYRIEFFRRKNLSDLFDIEQHSKKSQNNHMQFSLNLLLLTVWHIALEQRILSDILATKLSRFEREKSTVTTR